MTMNPSDKPDAPRRVLPPWPRRALTACVLLVSACGGWVPAPESPPPANEAADVTGAELLAGEAGLRATYFNNEDFTGQVLERIDPVVNFHWGEAAPGPGVGSETFSVRWEGFVTAPTSGSFTFSTASDDGVRLWVGGQEVIDNWTPHGLSVDRSEPLALTAGVRTPLTLEFFDRSFAATVELRWAGPGLSERVIPSSALSPTPPPPERVYGTLWPSSSRARAEFDAGVRTGEFVIEWSRYEPTQGNFDAAYIASRKRELQTVLAAGIKPTLSFSHHFTPAWVCRLPGAAFVNQNGEAHCGRPHNLVFSQTVRNAMVKAIEHIAADFGPGNFRSVRVMTAGLQGEVSYPEGGTYWAYDANASGGADRPASIPVRPFGNWKPGQRTLTTAQVREWLDWYLAALADAVDFQVQTYQRLGFTGPFHPISPGAGVKPRAVEHEIGAFLAGGNPWLGQGVAWYHLFGKYKTRASMTAYTSSLAERGSGQSCQGGDGALAPTSTAVDAFDVGRYTAWIASQYGVRPAGENPGCCGSGYGLAMMEAALRVADSCGYSHFYWAHSAQLHDGGNGVTLADYTRLIRAHEGP